MFGIFTNIKGSENDSGIRFSRSYHLPKERTSALRTGISRIVSIGTRTSSKAHSLKRRCSFLDTDCSGATIGIIIIAAARRRGKSCTAIVDAIQKNHLTLNCLAVYFRQLENTAEGTSRPPFSMIKSKMPTNNKIIEQ